MKTADTLSTFKDTIVKRKKAAIEVLDRSKPSGPVADGIDTGGVVELTRMEFESSVSKVSNISQSSELDECDSSGRNPILAIADGTKLHCG